MTNIRWNLLIMILLSLFLFLQYHLWFDGGGIKNLFKQKKLLAEQNKVIDELKKRNEELLFQIQRLQHSKDAAESRARNELGMIKKGEKFYQFVK